MKRFLKISCFILALFLLLVQYSPGALAENAELEDSPKSLAFDTKAIQHIIDINLYLANNNEDFYDLIANAYLLDSALFVETINYLSESDLNYIANGIAYSLVNSNKRLPDDNASQTDAELNFKDKISSYYIEQSRVSIDDHTISNVSPFPNDTADPLYLVGPPMISSFNFQSGVLNVGEVEHLIVNVNYDSSAILDDWYTIKVYYYGTNEDPMLASQIVDLSQTTRINIPVSFTRTGVHSIYVSLCDSSGYVTDTSKNSTNYNVSVYGTWHINIDLPDNRNYLGTLTLYSAEGTALFTTSCLGKSALNLPMSETNGDTPTGEYTGYLGSVISGETEAYGPYRVIEMFGVSGKIAEYYYRSGIWIHGGREGYSTPADSYYPLYPTYGCVRVSNDAQLSLQNWLVSLNSSGFHHSTGTISIY